MGGAGPAAVTEQMPFSDEGLRTVTGSDGGRYYVYDRALNVGGATVWVRGTIDSAAREGVMDVIVPLAWALLPGLVVVSALGGWLISSLSFKPMEKVIAAAESISGGDDLSKRIGLPPGKSEINRLAGAFDDMFDGWSAPLRRRRSLPPTPATSCGRPSPSSWQSAIRWSAHSPRQRTIRRAWA